MNNFRTNGPIPLLKKSAPNVVPIKKIVRNNLIDEINIHDKLKASAKDKNYPSKKNPRVEIITGDDVRKSDGKWMKKERLIDKDKDPKLYKELLIDPQTGEIVHKCEEPLSNHYGHGSDKLKKDDGT